LQKRKEKVKIMGAMRVEGFGEFNFFFPNTKSPNLKELTNCIEGGVWRVLGGHASFSNPIYVVIIVSKFLLKKNNTFRVKNTLLYVLIIILYKTTLSKNLNDFSIFSL